MKNERNIIALCLGLILAAVTWQYYLKPKYDIKRGKADVVQALYEADIKALDEATAEVDGDLIFRTDEDPNEYDEAGMLVEGSPVLRAEGHGRDDFYFESTANRPLDIYEQAARGDKRKDTQISIDRSDITLSPRIESKIPDTYQANESFVIEDGDELTESEAKSRFTMLVAPVKYTLIKTNAAYNKIKADNKGAAFPAVNFKKDMVVFLESDSHLSNGFFEIVGIEEDDNTIVVIYKVNIIGNAARKDSMACEVVAQSGKEIILKQIK